MHWRSVMVFVKYRERLEFAVAYFDERLGSLWLGRDFVGICTTDFLLKTECLYNFSSKWRKISSNLVIDTEVQLKFGKTKLIYSGCMQSMKVNGFFAVVYPCPMRRICSKLTQQRGPWCVAHSTSTGRIIRGFPYWAFPRRDVTRVFQPPAHTWRKHLLFSPSCKTVVVLYPSVCPKMCCLHRPPDRFSTTVWEAANLSHLITIAEEDVGDGEQT